MATIKQPALRLMRAVGNIDEAQIRSTLKLGGDADIGAEDVREALFLLGRKDDANNGLNNDYVPRGQRETAGGQAGASQGQGSQGNAGGGQNGSSSRSGQSGSSSRRSSPAGGGSTAAPPAPDGVEVVAGPGAELTATFDPSPMLRQGFARIHADVNRLCGRVNEIHEAFAGGDASLMGLEDVEEQINRLSGEIRMLNNMAATMRPPTRG
jgi:hypothetical protein